MADLLSQTAYAKRKGVSRQYINELVQKSVLPLIDGKIDPATADGIIAARREPARALRRRETEQPATLAPRPATAPLPSPTADPSTPHQRSIPISELPTLLLKTRIKSETEKAKLLEIKNKVESGKFVDADIVKAGAFRRGRIIRDAILSVPDRLDAVLAAETDRRKVHEILVEELTRALEELSRPPY